MTKIKRFYYVHEQNENFWKYAVSITSEMAFTEPLLPRKGHFLSRKRGRLFKKYFFHYLNGAFKPRKKGTFFTFKKSGGAHAPIALSPVPRPLCISHVKLTPCHWYINSREWLVNSDNHAVYMLWKTGRTCLIRDIRHVRTWGQDLWLFSASFRYCW
jgi:hypothetical protein